MNPDTASVAAAFAIEGKVIAVRPFGSGHINDTFQVETDAGRLYLLQKISEEAFENIPALTQNKVLVSRHIRQKLEAAGEDDIDRKVMTFIPGQDGDFFYREPAGGFWNMSIFIENSRTYDRLKTPEQAYEAGLAFGGFQAQLTDLEEDKIFPVIPFFHHIGSRAEKFCRAVEANSAGRKSKVLAEIECAEARMEDMQLLDRLLETGQIPRKIAHHDPKINNVLFDQNDKALCVIDLDTVMSGCVHYDFGDLIRTSAASADEDEADTEKMFLDLTFFEAAAKGFLEGAGSCLSAEEKEHLAFSVKLFPFLMGLRFLTDFLEGDVYYKTQKDEHNLLRCRAQFALLRSAEKNYDRLREIILKY